MRYTVVYDHRHQAWAVVDRLAPGRVIATHANMEAAKDVAWREEEMWYKAFPFTQRPVRACGGGM